MPPGGSFLARFRTRLNPLLLTKKNCRTKPCLSFSGKIQLYAKPPHPADPGRSPGLLSPRQIHRTSSQHAPPKTPNLAACNQHNSFNYHAPRNSLSPDSRLSVTDSLSPNVDPVRLRRNSTTSMQSYSQVPLASTSQFSGSNGGLSNSGNFLDPNCRRRLPMVPGANGSLSPTTIRRASSPRMLPTPPPQCSTPSSPHFSSASPSPPCVGGHLERKTSAGRRLPPEPGSPRTPPVQQNSLPTPFGGSPAPMNHQFSSPALIQKSGSRAPLLPHRQACLPPTPNSRIPDPLPMPTNNILPRSAPQSPRASDVQNGDLNGLTVNGSSPLRQRKFSDVRDLARNGSMGHVLEQQHLLRQEFTQPPESVLVHSSSNHSSLSPSMEQINCAGSSKSSSDGDDPSIHGLDPSLYATPTGSVSSYSVPDVAPGSGTPNGTVSTSNSWPENEPRPKGLAGELKPELELQPFCKVNLLPGKASKAQVSVVKRGRDAVFNQEFFFDGVATEELDSKILHIEVQHSSNQKLQKDIEIGEMHVPLKDFMQLQSKKEVRIVEELKHKISGKKAGKINLTTCVQNGVLTVNIIKVEDLPKWGFIGAPDVCVRVTVNQETGKKPNQVKQSRVMKSTCSAVYKESIAFLIQGKPTDLSKTQVVVSVHDMNRSVTGDDVIGSVYFGCRESEKAEAEQWRNTIDHQGKECKGTHNLKPPNSGNPDVHVSEAHSDNEDSREISNSPSRAVGITEEEEKHQRIEATLFIKTMIKKLLTNNKFLNEICCNACWLWQQVYMKCTLTELPYMASDGAVACFTLSAKTYDQPVRPRNVVEFWIKEKFPETRIDEKLITKMKGLLGIYEQLVMSCISLEVQPDLPFPRILMQKEHRHLSLREEVVQLAYCISYDLIIFFDWCKRFDADSMATIALYTAMTYYKIPIYPERDGRSWIKRSGGREELMDWYLQRRLVEMVNIYRKRVPEKKFEYEVEALLGPNFSKFLNNLEPHTTHCDFR
ncbi:hypothetical protein FO519_001491 [Halicephalobus sp. NKZ332]|nr:hypothetical protein FO519_001491 [Halicephalobus sp. NKZ332]